MDTPISSQPRAPQAERRTERKLPSAEAENLAQEDLSNGLPRRPPVAAHPEGEPRMPPANGVQTSQDYASLNLPNRAPDRVRLSGEDAPARSYSREYRATVLDKIVDFLAALIKSFERFLIGKLRSRLERREYRLRRIERSDPAFPAGTEAEWDPEALPGEKIKWQGRGKPRGTSEI